jgi:hypothetical protein
VADLITHACVAVLAKAATRPKHVAIFVAGTCLPDLLGRVPAMGLTVARWSLPAIPEWSIYVWTPFHMPVGVVLSSFAGAFAFAPALRRAAFWNLLGGGMLHMAVDLVQRHFGVGYLLLFPFSTWDFELGWIGSEDTVLIVPFLLPLTLWIARRRWGR